MFYPRALGSRLRKGNSTILPLFLRSWRIFWHGCFVSVPDGGRDRVRRRSHNDALHFFATAGAIARLGARPVFVEDRPCELQYRSLANPSKLSSKTRAIIPVHLYGQMAEMDAVMDIARAHHLIVIEDAAQAIGAEHNQRRAGSIGHYGCFSFFPSQNLGGGGDGGLVVTNDPARAEKLACLRTHGSNSKYRHRMIGGNFRLDALQAAIVKTKLPYLDEWTKARQRNARRYDELFRESGINIADTVESLSGNLGPGSDVSEYSRSNDQPLLFLPKAITSRHVFNEYIIRASRRDHLRSGSCLPRG